MKLSREDIADSVAAIIKKNFAKDIDARSMAAGNRQGLDLSDDLGLDSMDLMTFVMAVENSFNIAIPPKEIDKGGLNLADFVGYLEKFE